MDKKNVSVELREMWAGLTRPQDKETIEELPRWVKTALVYRTLDGMTWEGAAKRVNRPKGSLNKYGKSPAAKKWIETLLPFVDDPVELAKLYLRANALSVTVDRITFLEAAIEAGDYKAGDAIAKDIQEKLGIVSPKTKGEGPAVLNITIGSSVEVPAIEAHYEEVTVEEDDD